MDAGDSWLLRVLFKSRFRHLFAVVGHPNSIYRRVKYTESNSAINLDSVEKGQSKRKDLFPVDTRAQSRHWLQDQSFLSLRKRMNLSNCNLTRNLSKQEKDEEIAEMKAKMKEQTTCGGDGGGRERQRAEDQRSAADNWEPPLGAVR